MKNFCGIQIFGKILFQTQVENFNYVEILLHLHKHINHTLYGKNYY